MARAAGVDDPVGVAAQVVLLELVVRWVWNCSASSLPCRKVSCRVSWRCLSSRSSASSDSGQRHTGHVAPRRARSARSRRRPGPARAAVHVTQPCSRPAGGPSPPARHDDEGSQQRREQVAVRSTRASTSSLREDEVTGVGARRDLVPRHRRRDRRARAGAQRVDARPSSWRRCSATSRRAPCRPAAPSSCGARRGPGAPSPGGCASVLGVRATSPRSSEGRRGRRPAGPCCRRSSRHGCRPSASSSGRSSSATPQHSTIVAGGAGVEVEDDQVGRRPRSTRHMCVCSSRLARFAVQTSVARSSTTT